MNLMIERAFIVALLLSISGFVFCAIFLPFEKIAYKWTSARTMAEAAKKTAKASVNSASFLSMY